MNNHAIGDIVKGFVTEIAPYGAFIELDDATKGLLHISEISSRYVSDINEIIKLGQELRLKIITIDSVNGYMRLSLKQMPQTTKPIRKTRVRVKLPDNEINFDDLKKNLPAWIKQAQAENNEE